MGLMRARLGDDSSVTSLSNISSDFSNEKSRMPLRKPTTLHISSEDEDAMDVDRPRSISVPLKEVRSGVLAVSLNQPSAPIISSNLRPRTRHVLGSSPIASFSTPALPNSTGAARTSGDAFFQDSDPVSRASSNPSSDDFVGFESAGSTDVEAASGKSSQVSPDESEGNVVVLGKAKSGPKATETAPAISAAPVQEKIPKLSSTAEQHGSTERKPDGAEVGAVPSVLPVLELHEQKIPEPELVPSEPDQRAAGHAVIDYKLPRLLHQDLSPAPLMSHANPIWTIVQDMREQRMSLCQSLRQYVFVHAAVIEGALTIVDEEREIWGDSIGSEECSEQVGDGGRNRLTPLKNFGNTEICGMGRQSPRDRACSFPPVGGRRSASSNSSNQIPCTTVSTSPGVSSSPSKWKRGPSPTELLKEDKSGVVSTAKRPSINRRTSSNQQVLTASDLTGVARSSDVGRRMSNIVSGNMTHLSTGPMAPGQGNPSVTAERENT